MPIFKKQSGIWKETELYVKNGGVWKESESYIKNGGVWKSFYTPYQEYDYPGLVASYSMVDDAVNATTILDGKGTNNLTRVGSSNVTSGGKIGNCAYSPAGNNYFSGNNSSSYSPGSLSAWSAWFYLSSSGSCGRICGLGSVSFSVYIASSSSFRINVQQAGSGSGYNSWLVNTYVIPQNVWNHIYVYNSGTYGYVYFNNNYLGRDRHYCDNISSSSTITICRADDCALKVDLVRFFIGSHPGASVMWNGGSGL